ncbi:SOS cell division inhibitor [Marinobacter sp. C2H3]|uniref:SOS cell division inhibitor n=1 Tax=Marinobacter sp. C2H3 TaxID=3119003 RepID=UPI00300E87CA
MTPQTTPLDQLDSLLAQLDQALVEQDWSALSRLNAQVQPRVAGVMTALAAGDLDATVVRERLEQLQRFVGMASEQATDARAEAEQALKGVNRNRSAARAYHDISSNRPR